MSTIISELKELMLSIGMDKNLVKGIDPNKLLAHQGVDSIDCPAFAIAVEQKFGVKLTDSDSLKLKTLNDYAKFLGMSE